MTMTSPEDLFATLWRSGRSIAAEALQRVATPWQVLDQIEAIISDYLASQAHDDWVNPAPQVYLHRTVKVHPSAVLIGPLLVGANSEIRPNAYIRGHVLVGEGCVLGNSSELKQAILFDGVQVPHYNYVGDSILGYKAHLGAGAICSNYRADHGEVSIKLPECDPLPTGRRKLGALIGDGAEIGCHGVLNPGTVLGPGTRIHPLTSVRGYVPAETIAKSDGRQVPIRKD